MAFLGIDLGTSGVKVLLMDESGTPIASVTEHYTVQTPYNGWSEQNPIDWINAMDAAVAKLRQDQPLFARVRGIAVSGHMHGAVLLNKAGDVLRPCMLWNDSRAHHEAGALDSKPDFRELTGNIVFPGFTAPKIEWVKTHEPDVFAQLANVLLPAAYINYHLTGAMVTDMSDASGTAWLNVEKRAWAPELLAHSSLSADHMPSLIEGAAIAGQLRQKLQAKWGLDGTAIVAGGAADNAAAACGMGVLQQGQGLVSLGTSGVVLAARDRYSPAPKKALHTFCHAIPNTWYQMGVMLAATDCLNWLSRITGHTSAELTAELGETVTNPTSLIFLPYLSGERTPHNDAQIRGAFVGLSTSTTRQDMTNAVLQGVAFGLRDSFEALQTCGANISSLLATGGGAASDYWLKMLATTLGIPIKRPKDGEYGAALGAARLAQIAADSLPPLAIIKPPVDLETFEPAQQQKNTFDAAYTGFKAAYPAIRDLP